MSSKQIVKQLRANTGERDLHTVFGDFCSMSAIALRNRFDPHGHKEREDEYERTRQRYSEAQWMRFPEALAAVAARARSARSVDESGIFPQATPLARALVSTSHPRERQMWPRSERLSATMTPRSSNTAPASFCCQSL